MIGSALRLLVELALLFFGVAFAVGLVQRRFGAARLRAWMGGAPSTAALKGIAIGFVTPFCTYSAIPMLVGFRQAGVPPAGYVAFISAAPVLDPILFGALVVIVGLEAALVYSSVAFAAAIGLALVAQRADIDRHLKPIPTGAAVPSRQLSPAPPVGGAGPVATEELPVAACDATGELPWRGARVEAIDAAHAALGLLRSVALLLVVGVAAGLVIETTVSPSTVAAVTGDGGPLAIPLAAAIGTPLYVQTSVLVPIAEALGRAGLGIGAIVALTISGAGANIPELIILTRLARARVIAIFFAHVFGVAVVGGLMARAILG